MKVAVIGGGYAGMAAAVTLAERGASITVFEAARQLGGRARRVVVNDVALDNGLHLLIGAYRDTLRMIERVHPQPPAALLRTPLDLQVHGRFRLKAAPLPAPLHVAVGLATARGPRWSERYAAARFMNRMQRRRFALERDTSVRELLAAHGQGENITRDLWEPLCYAALNTPPRIASAQVFLNVLRDSLAAGRSAGDLLLARCDLSALFPDPAGDYVRTRGGEIRLGTGVEAVLQRDGQAIVVTREGEDAYDHAICALGPHRAGAVLARAPELAATRALLDRFRYQPIYSIYLQLAAPVKLPAALFALPEEPMQWVFDREAICGQRALVGVVISAEGPHEHMPQAELANSVYAALQRALGALPPLVWQRVIAEKRATFECSVGLERPSTRTPLSRIHLAGDYTASDYPATLEAAVRSGIAAAEQVLA